MVIGGGVGRRVEVQHARDAVDVDAAGRDVGGDERPDLAALERLEGPIALRLAATAVDRFGLRAELVELLGEAVGAVTGATEHERRSEGGGDAGHVARAVGALGQPEEVLGGGDVRALLADLVPAGVVLEVVDELGDRAFERRREQQHLALGGGRADDAAHGRQEAHVGHLVGLVDDDRGHLVEPQGTHLQQVLEAAGARHDQLGALVEQLALGAVADAAVDGRDLVAERRGVGRQRP